MRIYDLKTNHISNPLGYDMKEQWLTWAYGQVSDLADSVLRTSVTVARDADMEDVVYQTAPGESEQMTSCQLALPLSPYTRYYWRVEACTAAGLEAASDIAWFETGKLGDAWQGKWLMLPEGGSNPILRKEFKIVKPVKQARAYMAGYGLYECYLDGELVNDGYLQPGFNNYQLWSQYQTFDITKQLQLGPHVLGYLLGEGWYKGRFGVNGGFYHNFGGHFHLLCEIHIQYEDGTEEVIGSDSSFLCAEGPISSSGIYDGEIYDAMKNPGAWMQPAGEGFPEPGQAAVGGMRPGSVRDWMPAREGAPERLGVLGERYSLPVTVKEKRKPVSVWKDPKGRMILDLGQNISGWLVFYNRLPKGHTMKLRYGEWLEDGMLCRKNLASAKQEFIYTSDGEEGLVRPHFTYYGFRYVEITGLEDHMGAEDFEGWSLYSDMETIGHIETGNWDVNQLVSNAMWSQKDNFLEHPTDCPQRAERLGWTGDAQIYCGTACFNMNVAAFFRKYMKDVNEEQRHRNGMVPFIVPKIEGRGFDSSQEECSAAWSDVSTVVPWNLYLHYGDRALLREEYEGMKAWVEFVIRKDQAEGDRKLWQSGFHFGDWLALDTPDRSPFGMTDNFYISSCYYFYSTRILGKAASVLGYEEDADRYLTRAEEIRQAILKEYFTDGICKLDTQTAYALAIYMDIASPEHFQENGRRLVELIRQNDGHLNTGFVGTPCLCMALSKAGYSGEAYKLLLKEGCPGWMYPIRLGSTTIWESWDVLDEKGRFQGPGSLNHYAFGSIVEWIYRDVCGLNPMEEYPGFEKMYFAPKPDPSLGHASAALKTLYGEYALSWSYGEDQSLHVEVTVPYSGSALLRLPGREDEIELGAGIFQYQIEGFC